VAGAAWPAARGASVAGTAATGARGLPGRGPALRRRLRAHRKYTQEGGVTLRCVRARERVQLRVEDTRVGIPAGEIARIRDDFYQVGVAGNVSREGYGLGLSIVSRIAKLLGLEFGIESAVGKGSVFSLELPASDAAVDAPAAVERPRAPGSPRREPRAHILLVEDDPGVRNSTRMLLRMEGHAVCTASNLEEAVQLAAELPDIGMLVSDYHLGSNETGIEVVAAVRAAIGPDLRAILVTRDTSSAMRALTHDSNLRTLSKPVNADEMLALVDAMLESPGA
jgi:two-component system, sensor histidine kinase